MQQLTGLGINQCWGFSPALDLNMVLKDSSNPIHRALFLYTGDPLHILKTMASSSGKLEILVCEESLSTLARHLLLFSILIDTSIPIKCM